MCVMLALCLARTTLNTGMSLAYVVSAMPDTRVTLVLDTSKKCVKQQPLATLLHLFTAASALALCHQPKKLRCF